MQWEDEFAFKIHNDIVFEAAGPALSQAKREAKKFGKPYFRLLSTTPNNRDVPAGAFAYSLKEDAMVFNENIYDIPVADLEQTIADNSQNDFVYIKYLWRELHCDDKWYKEQCRVLLNNRLKIKREVDLDWPLSTDDSYYAEEQLEMLKTFEKETFVSPIKLLNRFNLNLVKGEFLDPEKVYILGVDVAAGVSRDASAITIIEYATEKPIGYFENNKIDTEDYKKLITFIMTAVLPRSVAVIERNSMGINLVQTFSKASHPLANRIYYSYKEPRGIKTIKSKIPKNVITSKSKVYGVDTTHESRTTMIEMLNELITNDMSRFVLARINEQISTLEQKKNGKIEHSSGAKDDVLMSYLIGLYGLRDRKNMGRIIASLSGGKKAKASVFSLNEINSNNGNFIAEGVVKAGSNLKRIDFDKLVKKEEMLDSDDIKLIRRSRINSIISLND